MYIALVEEGACLCDLMQLLKYLLELDTRLDEMILGSCSFLLLIRVDETGLVKRFFFFALVLCYISVLHAYVTFSLFLIHHHQLVNNEKTTCIYGWKGTEF
jgi:hypothetical protein